MYQSKVFFNGQTTLPKPVCEALGVKVGDTLRYFISKGPVNVLKSHSVTKLAGILVRDGQALVSLEEVDDAIAQGASVGRK